MTKNYRIIVEIYYQNNPLETISKEEIIQGELNKPSNCLDFSMGLDNQIVLIQGVQDKILKEKIQLLSSEQQICPICKINLHKHGTHASSFRDVFSDYEIVVQRLRCNDCGYEKPSTVMTLINDKISGDLKKIQATLGSTHSFRENEKIFELFSGKDRKINNHDRIKQVVNSVGKALEEINTEEKEILTVPEATKLVLNIDRGHIKTIEDQRSMEAMVSVVYKPECIETNSKNTKNYITSKNCAASILDDSQVHIKILLL
ncbi:MAG: hypothetical protein ABF289_00070 [Clostridiales bacterium]